MTLEEYLESKARYADFARTVKTIIDAGLSVRSEVLPPLLIQSRAKAEHSLRVKLEQRGLIASGTIETEIKDLAGCRLVFYTNRDVESFLRSRVVFDNFVVQTDETKFHHPVPGESNAERHYRAVHYIVSLTPERLALPEYARFGDMRCEIQIQTLLNHAWAETEHDIIYKNPLPAGFGTRQLDAIKQRMSEIMTKYLVPAGYEFQKVQNDMQRLKEGKDILQREPIEALEKASDNNERVELLTHLRDYVVPFYDDIEGIYPELRRGLAKVIHIGRTAEPKLIETAFGNFEGKTASDVTEAAIDILDYLRYVDIDAAFATYCEVLPGAASEPEKKSIMDAVQHLARNDIKIWTQVGPYVQSELLKTLGTFDASQRRLLRPIVLAVCRHALEPDVTGTSSPSFDTVSFHQGSVRVSDLLRRVRSEALSGLEALYQEAETEEEKRAAFDTMMVAARHPHRGNYGDDLISLTVQDTQRIVEFCAGHRQQMSYELLQHVEHSFLWFYRNTPSWTPANKPEIGTEINRLTESIAQFRDAANADADFVRYKTLVGFEAVFPPDWDADGADFTRTAEYRAARIDEYVALVSSDSAAEWLQVIKRCAATRSNDMATFPPFIEFLTRLAKAQPDIVLGYLADIPEDLVSFLPAILRGLEQSDKAPEAEALMRAWIGEGCYLRFIARHIRLAATSSPDLIRALSRRASEMEDVIAVIESAVIVVARSEFAGASMVDEVFTPCLRFLTARSDTRWVNEAWFQTTASTFFSALSETQAQVVLDNLLHHRKIDNHLEMILAAIANVAYDAVWQFFGTRLRRETAAQNIKYDAIPFKFFHAAPTLGRHPDRAVDIVKTWYVDGDPMFQFTGGRLVAIAFPDFPNALRDKLAALIATDGEAAYGFVWGILDHYKGMPATHPVYQALIDCLAENDDRLSSIETMLMGTGVVSGEFGFVEAYQRKKAEITSWTTDARPKIAAFAARYIRSLDRSIAAEQARSEEHLQLRRLDWENTAAE